MPDKTSPSTEDRKLTPLSSLEREVISETHIQLLYKNPDSGQPFTIDVQGTPERIETFYGSGRVYLNLEPMDAPVEAPTKRRAASTSETSPLEARITKKKLLMGVLLRPDTIDREKPAARLDFVVDPTLNYGQSDTYYLWTWNSKLGKYVEALVTSSNTDASVRDGAVVGVLKANSRNVDTSMSNFRHNSNPVKKKHRLTITGNDRSKASVYALSGTWNISFDTQY
ncbi:MAG: hypothetical protein U0670_08070 [Anaerolineae bacterium]